MNAHDRPTTAPFTAPGEFPLAKDDQLWSFIVMKKVRIAELKAQLSAFLRAVQLGESFIVLDRNTPIAHIVPIREPRRVTIRPPKPGAPPLNRVPLPGPADFDVDVARWLQEERQVDR
jgi:prevent-host-death family protein